MSRPDSGPLFTAGAWMAGIGFVVCLLFFRIAGLFGGGIGAGIFGLIAILGVLCFIVGVGLMGYRMWFSNTQASGPPGGPVYRYDETIVIARYAMNPAGEMLFDEGYIDFDEPTTRFFVRLQAPNQNTKEYRCNIPVWYQCGEGMKGIAYIQGDWVGQFTPTGSASGPRQTYST